MAMMEKIGNVNTISYATTTYCCDAYTNGKIWFARNNETVTFIKIIHSRNPSAGTNQTFEVATF